VAPPPAVHHPRVTVPTHNRTLTNNLSQMIAIATKGRGDMFSASVGGGEDLNRSQWEDMQKERKAALEKAKKKLAAKKKALEKKLADLRQKFLESKAGKATKKKLDAVDKERDKKIDELIKERNRRLGANCCGLRERLEAAEWFNPKHRKAYGDAEAKKKKILDGDMKKKAPKKSKEYKKAEKELKDTNTESKNVNQALEDLDTNPDTADVRP
jgi:DNA repair exonuclease SbcCD ATPase subunit